jgi:hypothetical protein
LLARYRRVLPSCTQYAGPKPLSARTVINVTGRVYRKSLREAIVPLRLVEHRDMWRDQPVQHRSRPVSGIPDKSLWLETEALFGPFDHGFCCADLGLANSAGGLDIPR